MLAGRLVPAVLGGAFVLARVGVPPLPEGLSKGLNVALVAVWWVMWFIPLRYSIVPLCALFIAGSFLFSGEKLLHGARNFFGMVRVYEYTITDTWGAGMKVRSMSHGTTLHGYQILDKKYGVLPTAYYTPRGPMGDVFGTFAPKDVLVMGLGAGTVFCHKAPGRRFTFIEIDPNVVSATREWFTNLSDCMVDEPARILLGDGRLRLGQMKGEKFDLLLVDAFTSDILPTHLVTREAMEGYLAHLTPGGLIMINVSSRHFMLAKVLAATARAAGAHASFVYRGEEDLEPYGFASGWVLISPDEKQLEKLEPAGWVRITNLKGVEPWTDDYSNMLSVLSIFQRKPEETGNAEAH